MRADETDAINIVVYEREMVADGVVRVEFRSPEGADLPEWSPGAHIDVHLPAMIRVDGTGKFELDYVAMDEEAGQEEGWFDAAQFEENMSTHYGRMVHLDDKTIMFANPEDAAEYIDFDLKPV